MAYIATRYIFRNIAILLVIPTAILVIYFLLLSVHNEIKEQGPGLTASVIPDSVNIKLNDNYTISKRLKINFSIPMYIGRSEWDGAHNLNQLLNFVFDNDSKKTEHFLYISANNSKLNFPIGQYEGIIRLYYSSELHGQLMNVSIPIDVTIEK